MDLFTALLQNAAFLIGLAAVHTLIAGRAQAGARRRLWNRIFAGCGVGILGLCVMLSAYPLEPGVFFDTRSVLLGLSGLFLGPIPTTIGVLMTSVLRLIQGGAGILTGLMVIFLLGRTWTDLASDYADQAQWRNHRLAVVSAGDRDSSHDAGPHVYPALVKQRCMSFPVFRYR